MTGEGSAVGGAERNARKKKQQQRATKAVVAARGASSDRTKVIIGVVVVAVLAVAVIGGVLWSKSGDEDSLANPPQVSGIDAPIARDAGVVEVGDDSAKVTLDLYEDFLCPACGSFKKAYGEQMKREIEAGTLKVRYHVLPFLIKYSSPEGYSRDSANAGLCAADEGKFWEYHETLFARQPEEGGPGYTKEELVKLGTDLGITGESFKQCVDSGQHEKDAQAELDAVKGTGNFGGTPTVMKDGQPVDWDDRDWLTNLVK